MSLEAQITRLADLTEKHNALLEKLLAATGTAKASANKADAADKPAAADKADKAEKAPAAAPQGPSFADVKKKLSTWLSEFSKEEDADNPDGVHPEVTARRGALKAAMDGLGKKQLPEFEKDADALARLNTWFDTKASVVDRGFGVGRLAKDPEPAAAASDDMGI